VGVADQLRDAVRKIPRGKVSSYGAVARAAGFPGHARQVVWALQKSRGIPWHRVVGAGGKILLTGERALEQRLHLKAEGVEVRNNRIDMTKFEHSWGGSPICP
jgi:methylated-DNA-protein-cysteine methyltransferase related protein